MGNSLRTASIHVLDDDSLLNVFYLYRPVLLGADSDSDAYLLGGKRRWVREQWWYKLAHVCQRWRNIILGSASYLGVSLVCTFGTPVTGMLAHSPPLPLVLDYSNIFADVTADGAEDEESAIVALKKHDRVRRIRLDMPVADMRKVVMAMDKEYPILERLLIIRRVENISNAMIFPESFQAPRLRHLALGGFTLPVGSRLLTNAVGLVTLNLIMTHPATYFYPNTLLQWLSSMPQLETLVIVFSSPVFNDDVERQIAHTSITAPVALPNLRRFTFRGFVTYSEALVYQIITPRLEKLQIDFFFNQLTFSVPRLLEFMNTTKNLRLDRAVFRFYNGRVDVEVYPRGETETGDLSIAVDCWHLDWQVSSVAQISNSLSLVFSAVEHLTLEHEAHSWSIKEHDEVDRIEWRRLLGSFRNVKTLRIAHALVEGLSLCLQPEDGELPSELLPELQELSYPGGSDIGDTFNSFVDLRQNAGHPITLVRLGSGPRQGPNPCSSSILGNIFDHTVTCKQRT